MSFIRASYFLAACVLCVSELTYAEKPESQQWPRWLDGAWKIDVVDTTCDGKPSAKAFAFYTHVLFHGGYRFSIRREDSVMAMPLIAQTVNGDTVHCVIKVSKSYGSTRAHFTPVGEPTDRPNEVTYVSYLKSKSLEGRFRFTYKLTRVSDNVPFAKHVKAARENELRSNDAFGEMAGRVLDKWIADHLNQEKIGNASSPKANKR